MSTSIEAADREEDQRRQKAIQEAREPIIENKLVLKLSYDFQVVLDISTATVILNALKQTEIYDTTLWDNPVIKPPKRISMETVLLSNEEYLEMKVKHLLLGNAVDGG